MDCSEIACAFKAINFVKFSYNWGCQRLKLHKGKSYADKTLWLFLSIMFCICDICFMGETEMLQKMFF